MQKPVGGEAVTPPGERAQAAVTGTRRPGARMPQGAVQGLEAGGPGPGPAGRAPPEAARGTCPTPLVAAGRRQRPWLAEAAPPLPSSPRGPPSACLGPERPFDKDAGRDG